MRTNFFLAALTVFACSAATANNSWTGWYIGAHAGMGSGESQVDVTLGGQWIDAESQELQDFFSSQWSTELNPSGSEFGIYAGYRHQFMSGLVLGGELGYSYLNIDDSRQTGPLSWPDVSTLNYDFGNRVEADSLFAVRPLIGYAFGDHLMFLTVGFAVMEVDAEADVLSSGNYSKFGSASGTLDGMQWSAGYEFAISGQWAIRAEYLATDMEDFSYDTGYRPGSSFMNPPYLESISQDLDIELFRLGVTHSF